MTLNLLQKFSLTEACVGRSYQGFDFGEVGYGKSPMVLVPVAVGLANLHDCVFPVCLELDYGCLTLGCCGTRGFVR